MRVGNEGLIRQALEGLTGVKTRHNVFKDYLEVLSDVCRGKLPVPWGQLRCILVRPGVVASLLNPSPRCDMVKALDEVDEAPALIMDGFLVGKEALWLVQKIPSLHLTEDEATKWLQKMTFPTLIVGNYQGIESYMGAPMKSFLL